MLYLFAGVQRSGDIRSFLLPMVTAEGYNLVLREVDIKRDATFAGSCNLGKLVCRDHKW